jgi:hypothetical protein
MSSPPGEMTVIATQFLKGTVRQLVEWFGFPESFDKRHGGKTASSAQELKCEVLWSLIYHWTHRRATTF